MAAVNGDAILRARLRRGWTQQQVVDRCAELGQPINDSNLSKVERGLLGCSPRSLAVLARALEVSVDDLLPEAPRSNGERVA